jgi:hypothetical protein
MKKTADKLESPHEIVKQFKQRVKTLRGHKSHFVRSKLATVYYLESNASLASSLMDEQEVYGLLSAPRSEVLALQVYIGGWPFKGSGVFEQRAILSMKGYKPGHVPSAVELQQSSFDGTAIKPPHLAFTTTELASIDPGLALTTAGNDNAVDSSNEVVRLVITESQHDMITLITKKVVKQIEKVSNSRVVDILLEVVFNSAWTPIVISARSIRVDNVPPYLESNAEKFLLVYVGGEAPIVPPVRGGRKKRAYSTYNIMSYGWNQIQQPTSSMAGQSMRDVAMGFGGGDDMSAVGGLGQWGVSTKSNASTWTLDQAIIAANSPHIHSNREVLSPRNQHQHHHHQQHQHPHPHQHPHETLEGSNSLEAGDATNANTLANTHVATTHLPPVQTHGAPGTLTHLQTPTPTHPHGAAAGKSARSPVSPRSSSPLGNPATNTSSHANGGGHHAKSMKSVTIHDVNSPHPHQHHSHSHAHSPHITNANATTHTTGHSSPHHSSHHGGISSHNVHNAMNIPAPDFTRPFIGFAGDESIENKLDADLLATVKVDEHHTKLDHHAYQSSRVSSKTRGSFVLT